MDESWSRIGTTSINRIYVSDNLPKPLICNVLSDETIGRHIEFFRM